MELPDTRLVKVFDKFTERISQKQTLSLRKLSNRRSEEIQFGRFIGNTRVNLKSLEQHLYNQMKNSCTSSEVLLIEDSSQMSFSLNRNSEGLGKVDKGQVKGFYLHPVLCIDSYNGACHGIAALEFYTREFEQEKQTRRVINAQRSRTPFEYKEGYRWYGSIEKAVKNFNNSSIRKTVIADRESDIFPVLSGFQQDLQVDYVIRARVNRPVIEGKKLYEVIKEWKIEHTYEVNVPATDKRSAHKAILQLKFGQVEVKRSEGKSIKKQPASLTTWVVEAKEKQDSVVGKEQPIDWILLTSHPIEDATKALQILEWYKQRWNIEQVFRTLKNKGLRFESSQITEYEKLKKIMILALMGAVKVLQLVRARNGDTNQSMSSAFNSEEEKFMVILNKQVQGKTDKLKNPYQEKSLAFAAWVIARLSGWSGYQSQRPPGPIDMLTGLEKFYERMQGYNLGKIT